MRKVTLTTLLSITLLVLLPILYKIYSTKNPEGKIYEVILTKDGFYPPEITINPADSIKFSSELNEPFWPASDLHPSHGIYPEFDPQEPIEGSSSWTFKFFKSGKWKYHNHLSPLKRGIIIVN